MKYEYFTIMKLKDEPISASDINEFGREGWELVTVVEMKQYFNAIFKRCLKCG